VAVGAQAAFCCFASEVKRLFADQRGGNVPCNERAKQAKSMTQKSEGAVKKSPANDFCLIGWAKKILSPKERGFFLDC